MRLTASGLQAWPNRYSSCKRRAPRQQKPSDTRRCGGACRATSASPSTPPAGAAQLQRPKPSTVLDQWKKISKLQQSGANIDIRITKVNRSGAFADVRGVEGFLPYTNIDPSKLPKEMDNIPMDFLVGQEFTTKIKEVDMESRRLILSERSALQEKMAAELNAGDVVDGVVSSVMDFGAFVSIGNSDKGLRGIRGLIHISELSWDLVMVPENVVQVGDVVRCKVVSTNTTNGNISLSLKRMQTDPLLETLDAVLPLEKRENVVFVPTDVPSSVEDILAALSDQAGIKGVSLGRQVEEKRAVSQDLELWISKERLPDGFVLVVRAGKLLQEINLITDLSVEDVKSVAQRVLRSLV